MKRKVVSFKNNVDELPQIDEAVQLLRRKWHLPKSLTFHINLILEEVFTNIVLYGYRDKNEHQIFITFTSESDILTIKVVDDAMAFNPLEVSTPAFECKSLEDIEPGGIGLHLVKNLVDDMGYEREENKNILILKKQV